jgi:cohesin loading factor subunit SCC2
MEESSFDMTNGEHDGSKNTNSSLGSNPRIVACLTTLYLFAKIRAQFLVEHVQTLQPYLSVVCKTKGDYQVTLSLRV